MTSESPSPSLAELAIAGDAAAREGLAADALVLFDAVLASGSWDDADARPWVSWVMVRKADVLDEQGEAARAEALRGELIEQWSEDDDEDSYVRLNVDFALSTNAGLLREQGRWGDEAVLRDRQVALYRQGVPEDRPLALLTALGEKALAEFRAGQQADAIQTYTELSQLADDPSDPEAVRLQAWALLELARAHLSVGDHAAARAKTQEVVVRFGGSQEHDLQRYVASAFSVQLDAALDHDKAQADQAARELLERFGDTSDQEIWRLTAGAYFHQAKTADERRNSPEAIRLYLAAARHSRGASDPDLRRIRNRAASRAATLLGAEADPDAGLAIIDDEIIELQHASDPPELDRLGRALLAKIGLLRDAGRTSEIVEVCSTITERLRGSSKPESRMIVARALISSATALAELGQPAEAQRIFDQIVADYADDALAELDWAESNYDNTRGPNRSAHLASVLMIKAQILGGLGRERDQQAVLADLIDRVGTDRNPQTAQIVELARELRA